MDRETLILYAWIVILTLIIAALMTIATPLGMRISNSVIAVVRGTNKASQDAFSDSSVKEQTDYLENVFDYSDLLEPGLYAHNDASAQILTWDQIIGKEKIQTESGENTIRYLNLDSNKLLSTVGKAIMLKGDLVIGDEVKAIGTGAFTGCEDLILIKLGLATETINARSFSHCTSLETFISNKYLKTIGNTAFQDDYQLTKVVLREELTSIGDNAFKGCNRLKEIEFTGTKSQWKEISIGTNAFPTNVAKIICADGVIELA